MVGYQSCSYTPVLPRTTTISSWLILDPQWRLTIVARLHNRGPPRKRCSTTCSLSSLSRIMYIVESPRYPDAPRSLTHPTPPPHSSPVHRSPTWRYLPTTYASSTLPFSYSRFFNHDGALRTLYSLISRISPPTPTNLPIRSPSPLPPLPHPKRYPPSRSQFRSALVARPPWPVLASPPRWPRPPPSRSPLPSS